MKHLFFVIVILCFKSSYSQFNNIYTESDSIDLNNKIFKIGNLYIYDYEIVENGQSFKLKTNENNYLGYKLVPINNDSIQIDQIHLIVVEQDSERLFRKDQTLIYFFQVPKYTCTSRSGVVDNDSNIFIHPYNVGFFESLRTAPFPFIKKPLKIGNKWGIEFTIPETIGDEKWGVWKGWLVLNFLYTLTEKSLINTNFGVIECYVTDSYAKTEIGTSRLKSYFSEKYGFVKLEYTLFTGLKLNMWLVDFKENQKFKKAGDLFSAKKYIEE